MKILSTLVVVLVLFLAPVFAEPFGVSLMHPGSLDGWNHGPKPIAGWTLEQGAFVGTAGGVELLSGFSADDCEIRFQWTVADGGKLLVHMPEVPGGKGLTLTLCEGDGCGRLLDGETELSPGVKQVPEETQAASEPEVVDEPAPEAEPQEGENAQPAEENAEPVQETGAESAQSTGNEAPSSAENPDAEPVIHTVAIRRADGKITVEVDGQSLYSLTLDTSRRFGLALAVAEGRATVTDIRSAEPLGELIFNGKDLTGWREDTPGSWVVENGELVLKPGTNQWIRSIQDYENFTISFEYKLKKGGNSGLAIRTPRIGWPSNDGFEMQLMDQLDPNLVVKDSLLSCYSNVPPICRVDTPGDEAWKQVVIKTDGWMISAWLDGQLVQQFNTRFHPELRYRSLRGWVGFQDHSDWVRFRNVRLREAPDGESLTAWYAHPDPNGATLLVDQLMNSEVLATDHHLRAAAVAMNVDAATPGEYVLADLKGPGVVTRLAIAKETDGRLSFYFDGETKPRIDCKPGELAKVLPKINHTGSPLAAILCYEKSLKIVAYESHRVDSRIEYVAMPEDRPIRSFVSHDETGIPRGWLAPPEFRSFRITWGTFHSYDPSRTIRTPEKKLNAGAVEPTVHVDGAGTIKYFKLLGDRAALQSDDLWIEVRVDRESEPAIAAPARFWLPGLVKQGGFHNFLFRDFFGLTSHLGIPFGDGVTITLANRGTKPIERVGLEVSVVDDETNLYGQPVGPMRLRGEYLAAGQSSNVFFERSGKGRLVGIVVDAPQGATPGITQLDVDSHRVAGWTSPDLTRLLGSDSTNFADMTSGNRDGMAWRYLLLAPVDFEKSIKMQSNTKTLPGRLVLFYVDSK